LSIAWVFRALSLASQLLQGGMANIGCDPAIWPPSID
jgi:hypothetical protein